MSDFGKELAVMNAAALEAAAIAARFTRKGFAVRGKRAPNFNSFVTDADVACERAIKRRLSKAFPDYAFYGEEDGKTKRYSEHARRFIVDPIDGTHNFTRDLPDYGPLIALQVDGDIVAGVAHTAHAGNLYWAERGHGTFRSTRGAPAQRVHVSNIARLKDATVVFDHLQGMGGARPYDRFEPRVKIARCLGQLVAYVLLADGRADVAVSPFWKPWDLATPKILIEEAGGTWSNQRGERGWRTVENPGHTAYDTPAHDWIIATNAKLHAQALRAFNAKTR
ncbi:Fructose-1,6-bisphosphatase/inositol-1-monophosphatase [uncultured archaeon]|nr:Fructose-1,6-bisphosphatase/inositol-1-monophosphatase [uncultured archaeon]